MPTNQNSYNYKNRNLSDVFKELEEIRNNPVAQKEYIERTTFKPKGAIPHKANDLKLSHIITGCSVLVVAMSLFFPKNLAFNETYAKSDSYETISDYELNRHRLNIQNIITENVGVDLVKEQVTEERPIEFETIYTNIGTLPKGEEIVTQEGVPGTETVTVVKTYENKDFTEEIILNKETITEFVPKLINLGTSEFLAKHKVHIGDTMYFTKDTTIKDSTEDTANDVAEVEQYIDVKLLDLPTEEWCKVSFDGVEGYTKTANLTSATTTPTIVEKNRIKRILLKVNVDMQLNKVSGLTLNDYRKIFTGLSNDVNDIFQNNYQVFYNIEKKYNINGIFLASMAIHESAWGTSQIAKDKNNLFGYGSYDSTPYESSFEFSSYEECIETVAKSLVKYYINPIGTKIYDGETATGAYFNGPTLAGVNTRYASDQEWHKKVFIYMEMLYNRL